MIRKNNIVFNICMFTYFISAILSLIVIVSTVVWQKISIYGLVLSNVTILIDSLLLAYICFTQIETEDKYYSKNKEQE